MKLEEELKIVEEAHFLFPYSGTMQAFIFGNFDDKKAFRVISDDDVVEVLNDLNTLEPPRIKTQEMTKSKLKRAKSKSLYPEKLRTFNHELSPIFPLDSSLNGPERFFYSRTFNQE